MSAAAVASLAPPAEGTPLSAISVTVLRRPGPAKDPKPL